MASPPGPLTPPAEPSSSTQPISQPAQSTQSAAQPTSTTHIQALLSQPLTSTNDDGKSNRPRDARLIHLLLASHGVAAYQERVPLQLMDFAYRYTSSILSDALHTQSEGYDQPNESGGKGRKKPGGGEEGDMSLQNLRIAIASRMSYQFQGSLPKEFLKGLAEERNRIGLGLGLKDAESKVGPTIGGVRLPHEKYLLTGVGWGLKDEWESEGEESVDMNGEEVQEGGGDAQMQLDGGADLEGMDEDEDGIGNMEDVFGPDDGGEGRDGDGGGGGGDEDQEMEDS